MLLEGKKGGGVGVNKSTVQIPSRNVVSCVFMIINVKTGKSPLNMALFYRNSASVPEKRAIRG
jgi:hypothetical protein